jgi:hypothetical protein
VAYSGLPPDSRATAHTSKSHRNTCKRMSMLSWSCCATLRVGPSRCSQTHLWGDVSYNLVKLIGLGGHIAIARAIASLHLLQGPV